MSMFNDIEYMTGNEQTCLENAEDVTEYAKQFQSGNWCFCGFGQERARYRTSSRMVWHRQKHGTEVWRSFTSQNNEALHRKVPELSDLANLTHCKKSNCVGRPCARQRHLLQCHQMLVLSRSWQRSILRDRSRFNIRVCFV